MEITDDLRRILNRVGNLPSIPVVVNRIIEITNDPNSTMEELSKVIELDPGLTAKVLRVSNSPYYGMRQSVGSLQLALVVLGIKEVRNIVLGVSVLESFRKDHVGVILEKVVWPHSIKVAAFSKKLGQELGLRFQGEAFVAGLLHDIGKIILLDKQADIYTDIFNTYQGIELCNHERETVGFSHCEAAAALAIRWNFPETLRDSLLMHHADEAYGLHLAKDGQLCSLIRLADWVVTTECDDDPTVNSTDMLPEVWEYLDFVPNPIEPDKRCEVLKGVRDEISAFTFDLF